MMTAAAPLSRACGKLVSLKFGPLRAKKSLQIAAFYHPYLHLQRLKSMIKTDMAISTGLKT